MSACAQGTCAHVVRGGANQVMEASEPWSQQAAWQALLALRPRLRRFATGLTARSTRPTTCAGGLRARGGAASAVGARDAFPELGVQDRAQPVDQPATPGHRARWPRRAGGSRSSIGCDGERTVQAKLDPGRRAAPGDAAVGGAAKGADAGGGGRTVLRGRGDVLGVPAGTVASRVARARLALVQALEGRDIAPASSAPALTRSGS